MKTKCKHCDMETPVTKKNLCGSCHLMIEVNKPDYHDHKWHFVEKRNAGFNVVKREWYPPIYQFVCECGATKLVEDKNFKS